MATSYINLVGKCSWAKVHKPDTKYNNYAINLHLDKQSMEIFKNSGLQLQVKNDPVLGPFIALRRPVSKLIKGQLQEYGPPKVEEYYDNQYHPSTKLIGNGSIVQCNVAVYDTVKGKGHTLASVVILKLVEYTGGRGAPLAYDGDKDTDVIPF